MADHWPVLFTRKLPLLSSPKSVILPETLCQPRRRLANLSLTSTNRYTTSLPPRPSALLLHHLLTELRTSRGPPCMTPATTSDLELPFSEEEVVAAIASTPSGNSPGPDSFTPGPCPLPLASITVRGRAVPYPRCCMFSRWNTWPLLFLIIPLSVGCQLARCIPNWPYLRMTYCCMSPRPDGPSLRSWRRFGTSA